MPNAVFAGKKLIQAINDSLFGFGRSFTFSGGRSVGSEIDYEKEVGDLTDSDLVMIFIAWKMRQFPNARLSMRQRLPDGTKELVEDHPLLSLLHNPNPIHDLDQMLQATVVDYDLTGNAYWLIIRDMGNTPRMLWYVPSYTMAPYYDYNQTVEDMYYEYRPDSSTTQYIHTSNVIHFKFGIDPLDIRLGISPLRRLFREVYTEAEAANWVATLITNMGTPGAIISADPDSNFRVTDVELEKMRLFFQETFTGENRGMVFPVSGGIKVHQLAFKPVDMGLIEQRYLGEERIGASLGVPPIVVSLGSGLRRATYSNAETARKMAWQDGILPLMSDYSGTLNKDLLSEFSGYCLEHGDYHCDHDHNHIELFFDTSEVAVLQENINETYDRMDKGVRGGWVRVSEAKRAVGLTTTPEDDIYLRPGSGAFPGDLESAMRMLEAEGQDISRIYALPKKKHTSTT